jgi:hypothetical protein
MAFQLQRAIFDADSKREKKIMTPFVFSEKLWLKRYLWVARQARVEHDARLAGMTAVITTEMAVVEHYKNPSLSLDTVAALEESARCLLEQDPHLSYAPLSAEHPCVQLLRERASAIRETVSQSHARIDAATQAWNQEYAASLETDEAEEMDLLGGVSSANLAAVVMHSGARASVGHYQVFIRRPGHCDTSPDGWFRMNDTSVTTVSLCVCPCIAPSRRASYLTRIAAKQ